MKPIYSIFGLALLSALILGGAYLFSSRKSANEFLSSATKADISVINSDSRVVVWRDGPFVYKTKKGESGTTAPYAARGRVTKIEGRTFEVTNYEGGQPSSATIKLLEGSDATALSMKNGDIKEVRDIAYTDIRLNDKVEFHSIKPAGNLYESSQVFLYEE